MEMGEEMGWEERKDEGRRKAGRGGEGKNRKREERAGEKLRKGSIEGMGTRED